MATHHILIADYQYFGDESYFTYEVEKFTQAGCQVHFGTCTTEEDIIAQGQGMDAILCCNNPPIGKKAFEALPQCKIFLRYGIGYNSIDVEEATKHDRLILFMPGFCVEELATHSVGMAISLLRSLSLHDRHIRQGIWQAKEGMMPHRLSGMTIGLLGYGGSARLLGRIYAQGFGSRVIAHDPYLSGEVENAQLVDMDTLLAESDILSIHVPYTPETHHLFNADTIAKMKSGAILINTSRGPIIEQSALVEALQSGKLGGAGLDVYEQEPLPTDSVLKTLDNVIMTPHSAYYSDGAVQTQHEMAVSSVLEALSGKLPRNIANKDILNKK